MEKPLKAYSPQKKSVVKQETYKSPISTYNYSRYQYKKKSRRLSSKNFILTVIFGFIVLIGGASGLFATFLYNPNIPSGIRVKEGNEIVWDIKYNEQNCIDLQNHYSYFIIDTSYTQKRMNVVYTNETTMFEFVTFVGILVDGFVRKDSSNEWEKHVDDYSIQFQCYEDAEYYIFNTGLYLFSTFDIFDYYIIPTDIDYEYLAMEVFNQLGSGGYFDRGLPVERENGFAIIGLLIPGQGIVDLFVEYSGSILSSYRLDYNSKNCVTMTAVDMIPGIPNIFIWVVVIVGIVSLIAPFTFNLGKYFKK